MELSDKCLVCADCGRNFLWDAGEQAWYQLKKLGNAPKHCKDCRDRRREERLHQPRQYSKVACNICGGAVCVPFVPRGIKPVYCRSCLTAQPA